MTGDYQATDDPFVTLVPIDPSKHAFTVTDWLQGNDGRETLLSMGMPEARIHESTKETEYAQLNTIATSDHERAWMIKYQDAIVGILEIELQASQDISAPSISIMIGDKSVRKRGIGKTIILSTVQYLRAEGHLKIYARRLIDNAASAGLLAACGFVDYDTAYTDEHGLVWQNMINIEAKRILFICEGNMMRSQMAEAFYNHMTNKNDAMSAGAIADEKWEHISPRAIEVMDEEGIDTRHLKPLLLTEKMIETVDKIIYFPSDFMPEYVTKNPKAELWDVADPHYNREEGMAFVRKVRDDIKRRVTKLIGEL